MISQKIKLHVCSCAFTWQSSKIVFCSYCARPYRRPVQMSSRARVRLTALTTLLQRLGKYSFFNIVGCQVDNLPAGPTRSMRSRIFRRRISKKFETRIARQALHVLQCARRTRMQPVARSALSSRSIKSDFA